MIIEDAMPAAPGDNALAEPRTDHDGIAPAPRLRTVAVVTTCHAAGWEEYGRTMVESFDRHWPQDVKLLLYAEGFDAGATSPRVEVRNLVQASPALLRFKARHRFHRRAHGRVARRLKLKLPQGREIHSIPLPLWSTYRYKWDAVRFSHKMFAIFHAAATAGTDILLWIDADTRFFDDVQRGVVESFVPPDRFVGFLERPTDMHTECGFVAYNLRHPGTASMLAGLSRMYDGDAFLQEREFHDSFLFDVVRRRVEAEGHASYDIAQGVGLKAKHVLINSSLGRFMDHMKGKRKARGRSGQSDLLEHRTEAYWRSTT